MTPFRVQCETCQSWLKVRQEKLMGQIHRCPQCGGMVHLIPTEAAPAKPEQAAEPVAAAAPANDFDSVDALGLDAPAETTEPAAPPEPVQEATTDGIEAPAEIVHAPAESFGRKIAVGIGAAGTLLICMGLLGVSLARDDEQVAQVDARPFDKTPPIVESDSGEEQAEPTAVESVTVRKPAAEDPPAEKPAAPVDALPELPITNAPRPAPATNPAPAAIEPPPAAAAAIEVEDVAQTPVVDPLDYDPASLDLVMLRNPGAKQPRQRPNIRENSPLENQPQNEPASENHRVASLDNKLAKLAKDQRLWIERDTTAFEPHTPVDLARRLNESVPEFYLPEATLGYAVRVWGDLAGVPVTIDPVALSQAGVSLDTRITLKGQDESLSEVLLTGLKPVRLGFEDQAGRLVLSRRGAEKQQQRTYDVSDLMTPDAKDASGIADLARQFVLDEQAAGGLAVEGKSLNLNATAGAHYDLMIFFERLRRARGLKQHTRYPAKLLSTAPSLAEISPALSRDVTFSFIAPTPLADIIDHWRTESGVEMLVDWASLASAKLGPRSLVQCSARETSWREALDGLLSPLGLAWRPVDRQTLQITTTDQTYSGAKSIEFYPLERQSRDPRVAGALQESLAAQQLVADVVFDSASSTLVVRAPGAGQQQAYQWLTAAGHTK